MAKGLIADNWSLQDISDLFLKGMDDSDTHEIIIQCNTHSYEPVSYASIQTEALFDFLTDLVLRDEIWVDDRYENTWNNNNSPILKARDYGVVRGYPFLNEPERVEEPRERIVKHMCTTESLVLAHQENIESWGSRRKAAHELLSQVLWGGAGMCARSFVSEKSYTPHPLRKRFFVNSGFMLSAGDALHQFTSFLNDERVKVSKKLYGSDELYSLYVNMPAIPIRIIQESAGPKQLIDVALEMRKDFKMLRKWLICFQEALTQDIPEKILDYRKELDSVSKYVSNKIGMGTTEKPVTMEAGISIFKFSTQFDPINTLKNQFGVRATLNKLIFGPNGRTAIKKYTKMFGQQRTSIGYAIQQQFTKKV